MATILDLLKKNKEELYGGVAGNTFIESRGLINIPRATALAASSPSSIADLIGNQISGILKGSAKRPSDTIFNGDKPFNKPVTLTNVPQDAIEAGKDDYFIKQSPAPDSLIARLKQGASSPSGIAANIGANTIKNTKIVNQIKNIKKSRNSLREFTKDLKREVINKRDGFDMKHKGSEYVTDYLMHTDPLTESIIYEKNGIKKFDGKSIDIILQNILRNTIDPENPELYMVENRNIDDSRTPYVLISLYPNRNNKILLPATISGLTEDISPEISSFKYIGSPFNSYKYNGVERTIKFNLKLYYVDAATKNVMIKNLNKLRKLVYPSEKLAQIIHGTNTDSEYVSALAYNPNLIYLTIYGLYKEVFGIIDSLSFDIEDNITWPTTEDGDASNTMWKYTAPHPSVINVSISMKVLETPIVWNNDENWEYEYSGDYSTYFVNNSVEDRITNKSQSPKKQITQDDIDRQRVQNIVNNVDQYVTSGFEKEKLITN